ncbi:heme exporter protein CcmB [Alterisphingorhabdus coralli]|uniref:Heme exporter protein B n=1 Tax=Alterisphingorhabdus coralli TaxID=3071408 RepID=A0AA97F8J9_9SPHN|nr:heme exporter protein CcmB [Parasphingorhabdus sp. SCSIO 66989]WOE76136.1 heme exporter protein CcmB [Parasphingorhabdus sp. SCSIO 66989]
MSRPGLPAILLRLIRRDVARAYGLGGGDSGQGGFLLPVLFFLTVAILYPFAVGPDMPLLSRTGGGVIWVAALLAAILPIDRLVLPDQQTGHYDFYAVRGIAEEWIMAAKIIAHWLSFAPPLLLATIIASALLGQDSEQLTVLMTGLLLATPGLAALAVLIAAIMAGLRSGTALGGLLFLPLAVPMLIFGAGSNVQGGQNGFMLLAAVSLFLVAISPIAAGAAIRAARD